MRRKPESHTRKRHPREIRKLIIIACEGTKTEPTYFKRFIKRGSGLRIVIPNTSRTDPINLVKFAIKKCDEYGFDIINGDGAYCVYDVNSNTDRDLTDARKLAYEHGIKICLSNPCFELWYLLHYERYSSRTDCAQLIDRLICHIPNYRKSIDLYDLIEDKRQMAIKNAKYLNNIHDSSGRSLHTRECNPSTQVFKIVEYIQRNSA